MSRSTRLTSTSLTSDPARPRRITPRPRPGRRRSAYATSGSRRTARLSTGRPTSTPSSGGSPATTWRRRTRSVLTNDIPWDVEAFDLCRRRPNDRLPGERGRTRQDPHPRRRDGPRAPGASPACRAGHRPRPSAQETLGVRLHSQLRPRGRRRLLVRPGDRPACALDAERDRRARPGDLRRAGAGPLPDASTAAQIPAFVYRPRDAKFTGKRPVLIDIHGGPEGQFRPGFLGRLNYYVNELGVARGLPQRPRLGGLRQVVPEARQRLPARGLRQGHRRPARLGRHAARPRRLARGGDRRVVRRFHVAGHHDALQRPAQGGHRRGRASPTSSRS